MSRRHVQTLLLDLDGTLLDTAPDLATALNATLEANGHKPLPLRAVRPVASHGSTALVRLGFGIEPIHPDFEALREQLLAHYRAHIAEQTGLFPGMDEVLGRVEESGLTWGVVTNKPRYLTEPLLETLGLRTRAAGVVCGDTCKERKPHPGPLLHACKLIGATPEQCLYVGDAERDIRAGHDAGMTTLVAVFGYLSEGDRPETWGADALIHAPRDILAWLV